MSVHTHKEKSSLAKELENRFWRTIKNEKEKLIKEWVELDNIILKERNKIWAVKDFKTRMIWNPNFGIIKFKRRRYFNKITKKYKFLLDEKINLPKRKFIMPEHRTLALFYYRVYRSYKEIAMNVYEGNVSKMSIHRFIAEQDNEPFQAKSFKCSNDGILWINADGLWHKLHSSIKEKRSLESKNFVFFTGRTFVKKRWKLEGRVLKHFIDTPITKIIDELEKIIYSYEDVREIRIIGDGARWIKTIAKKIGATYYIDKFHIRKSLKDLFKMKKYYQALKIVSQDIPKKQLKSKLLMLLANQETGELESFNHKLLGYIINNHKYYIRSCSDNTIGVIEAMHAHYFARYVKNQRKGFSIKILNILLNNFTSFSNGSWKFQPGQKESFEWQLFDKGTNVKNIPVFNRGISSEAIYKTLQWLIWK